MPESVCLVLYADEFAPVYKYKVLPRKGKTGNLELNVLWIQISLTLSAQMFLYYKVIQFSLLSNAPLFFSKLFTHVAVFSCRNAFKHITCHLHSEVRSPRKTVLAGISEHVQYFVFHSFLFSMSLIYSIGIIRKLNHVSIRFCTVGGMCNMDVLPTHLERHN